MQFASTRDAAHRVGFSEALGRGLAAGGGLYVPLEWPAAAVAGVRAGEPLAQQAAQFLAPFASGDALATEMPAITAEAFNFPAPLVPLDGDRLGVLELFHGPTAAFKDFGARFLAAALTRLRRGVARPLKILVATSGDTGGAVAAAFHRQPGIEVVVLFPKGQVSRTQQQQLTCWGENVQSLAVRGSFDDCQRLVKQAFMEPEFAAHWDLSSANSINLGRLLPQAVYYVAASLQMHSRTGAPASFIIPSGNLGNATACVWARRLGAPIGQIVLAHNANRTVPDYLSEGVLRIRASVATLASAMDVGNPSNLERLTSLYPDAAALGLAVSAVSIDDGAIRARIRADYERFGALWCPHTATGAEVYARLPAERRKQQNWILVATAHPAKFREVVEPLVGRPVPVPESLERLFRRPTHCTEIDATLASFRAALAGRAA
jgi:threonine synthase